MYAFIITITVIVAVLLVIVVLIQKSKGGGLASNFAGGNQVLGVRHTNDFIEKATWTLAGIILVLSVLSSFMIPNSAEGPAIRTTGSTAAPAAQQAPQIPAGNTLPGNGGAEVLPPAVPGQGE